MITVNCKFYISSTGIFLWFPGMEEELRIEMSIEQAERFSESLTFSIEEAKRLKGDSN